MPSAYTPTPQIGATDPPLPDGPPSNAATHRELLNNRQHLRGATWAQLAWSGRLRVTGTSNTVFSVEVGVIEAVTLRDSNSVWRPYYTTGLTTLDLTHVEGAPANLANDTFYYVYAWSDSAAPGAVKFQISTDPPTEVGTPTVPRLWKRGQTANYRYLGWLRTNGTGVPVAAISTRGVCTLLDEKVITQVAGGDVSGAALAVSAVAPPHAAGLRARVAFSVTGGAVISVQSPGAALAVASTSSDSGPYDFVPDASGLLYNATLSGGTASLSLYVQSVQE